MPSILYDRGDMADGLISDTTVDAFKKAPESKQRDALAKMSAPAKEALKAELQKVTAPSSAAQNPVAALTENPKNEGIYKIKDVDGKVHGVPFSNVHKVDDYRNHFIDEAEAQRYEKDKSVITPNFAQRFIEDHIFSHTGHLSEEQKKSIRDNPLPVAAVGTKDPEEQINQVEFARGVANGGVSLAAHPWEALKGSAKFINDAVGYLGAPITGNKTELRQSDEFKKAIGDMVSQLTEGKVNISKYDDVWKDVLPAAKDISTHVTPYSLGQIVGQILVSKGHAAVSAIMFAMVSEKRYEPIIWKQIRPRGDERPYKADIDG